MASHGEHAGMLISLRQMEERARVFGNVNPLCLLFSGIFLFCLEVGCHAVNERKGITTRSVNEDRWAILDDAPSDAAYVTIIGEGFNRSGYVQWRPGLSLNEIEHAVGYNTRFTIPAWVSITRDRKRIFRAGGTEYSRETGANTGPILAKPNAPELEPGDTIHAGRIVD